MNQVCTDPTGATSPARTTTTTTENVYQLFARAPGVVFHPAWCSHDKCDLSDVELLSAEGFALHRSADRTVVVGRSELRADLTQSISTTGQPDPIEPSPLISFAGEILTLSEALQLADALRELVALVQEVSA